MPYWRLPTLTTFALVASVSASPSEPRYQNTQLRLGSDESIASRSKFFPDLWVHTPVAWTARGSACAKHGGKPAVLVQEDIFKAMAVRAGSGFDELWLGGDNGHEVEQGCITLGPKTIFFPVACDAHLPVLCQGIPSAHSSPSSTSVEQSSDTSSSTTAPRLIKAVATGDPRSPKSSRRRRKKKARLTLEQAQDILDRTAEEGQKALKAIKAAAKRAKGRVQKVRVLSIDDRRVASSRRSVGGAEYVVDGNSPQLLATWRRAMADTTR